MQDPNIAQQISRAKEAERLLKSELLQEIFNTIEARIVSEWRSATVSETHQLLIPKLEIGILDKIKNEILSILNTGRLASQQQESDVSGSVKKSRSSRFRVDNVTP